MGTSPSPHRHACVRAFEEQFEYVHRTLRRQGVPEADVEDLAQEVFIVMWRRWPDFDPRRGLRPWLAGIAFNVVGSHHLRRPRVEIPSSELEAADPAPHGEEGLAARRARRVVLQALDRLPQTYRTILVLRDIEGMPMRQIAALQKVPLFTAYTRLRRARRDFAEAFKQQASEPRRPILLIFARALARALALVVLAAAVAMAWRDRPAPAPSTSGETSPPSLAHGLLGYWRFDEAGGQIARDLSGQASDCQLRLRGAGSAWTRGRHGAAVQLDARRWLECPQPPLGQAGAGDLTVSTWLKVRSLPPSGNRAVLTRQLGGGTQDHFFLGFTNGRLTLNSDSWRVSIRSQLPGDDGWHHVAFTKSGSEVILFVDGAPVGSKRLGPVRPDPVDAPMLVGGGVTGNAVYELFDGTVDELLLYDRALSGGEIAALAEGLQPPLHLSALNAR